MTYGSSSRNGQTVRLVVVHTGEGILDADDMAAFLDNNDGASAHAACDSTTLRAPLVPYDRAAWTLGNGNAISDNIELCGYAQMTRDQWLSQSPVTFYVQHLQRSVTVRNPYDMLRIAAQWAGDRCRARGIPIRYVSPQQIRNGEAGICGHIDYNQAYAAGDHWDPGPGFPWGEFIQLANGEDMPLNDTDLARIADVVKYKVLASGDWRFDNRNLVDMLRHLVGGTDALRSELQAVADRVGKLEGSGVPATVDEQAIAEAVADELAERGQE